jgi:hypothetical protein
VCCEERCASRHDAGPSGFTRAFHRSDPQRKSVPALPYGPDGHPCHRRRFPGSAIRRIPCSAGQFRLLVIGDKSPGGCLFTTFIWTVGVEGATACAPALNRQKWPCDLWVKWIFPFGPISVIVERSQCIHYRRGQSMKDRTRIAYLSLLLLLLAFIPANAGPASNQEKTVYVCACLKTKSCACMTEAKMRGPCACGTEGGPPMKAVPADSDWAKQNREALAK